MKKTLVSIMLLSVMTANGQIYFGSETGIFFQKYKIKSMEFKSQGMFYMMPIGYEINNWVVETQPGFYGLITTSLEGGRRFDLNPSISISLLSGMRMDMSKTDSKFYPEVTSRILLKHFMIQGSMSKDVAFIGIGFMGFSKE